MKILYNNKPIKEVLIYFKNPPAHVNPQLSFKKEDISNEINRVEIEGNGTDIYLYKDEQMVGSIIVYDSAYSVDIIYDNEPQKIWRMMEREVSIFWLMDEMKKKLKELDKDARTIMEVTIRPNADASTYEGIIRYV